VNDRTLIITSSLILSAHIGRALTSSQFKDWQVANSADEALKLLDNAQPSYIILDITVAKSDLRDFCVSLAQKTGAALILILNQPSSPQFTELMEDARHHCKEIIATYEFPLDVNQLVQVMIAHRSEKENPPSASVDDAVDVWLKSHPGITGCTFMYSDGQMKKAYGEVPEGQAAAAHYLMAVARNLGSGLGLTHLAEIHQHGPEQKFLMIDSGDDLIAIKGTSKIDLKTIAAQLTPAQS
jgi:CheY-like chemotaxis protein